MCRDQMRPPAASKVDEVKLRNIEITDGTTTSVQPSMMGHRACGHQQRSAAQASAIGVDGNFATERARNRDGHASIHKFVIRNREFACEYTC